jgi:hypothetical protein
MNINLKAVKEAIATILCDKAYVWKQTNGITQSIYEGR